MGLNPILYPTLLDVAKRSDPDGKIAKIADILNQHNEILNDMVFVEGNLPTGHKTTVRTGLPASTWRKLNYGVQPSKSGTKQITDTIGMLEAYAEVDKSLADLNGNTSSFRLSEDMAFIESMNQTVAQTLFYGDTTVNPERFMGFAPRYNTISGAANGLNVISAGGSGSDNTSIWLVYWGPDTVHSIYPKGSRAGLLHEDLGEHTLFDTNTPPGKYQGYRSHYKWDLGLTVRDWRYIVRICNIDYSDLQTVGDGTDTSANLFKLMTQALARIPNKGYGKPAFYCNRLVYGYLLTKLFNQKNMFLHISDYENKPGVLMFMGVPIRSVWETTILNTEATIT